MSATEGQTRFASEDVILSSPMSYSGSRVRLARIGDHAHATWSRVLLAVVVVLLIAIAWVVITAWYLVSYTLLFLPTVFWRHHRRSQRKDKVEQLRHREMLATMQAGPPTGSAPSKR